jgi:ankyrin repeat protein
LEVKVKLFKKFTMLLSVTVIVVSLDAAKGHSPKHSGSDNEDAVSFVAPPPALALEMTQAEIGREMLEKGGARLRRGTGALPDDVAAPDPVEALDVAELVVAPVAPLEDLVCIICREVFAEGQEPTFASCCPQQPYCVTCFEQWGAINTNCPNCQRPNLRLLNHHGLIIREALPVPNPNERLLLAALEGNLLAVRAAINDGAEIDFADLINRYTALHIAARHGYLPIVEFLWNNGANREALTISNATPLHVAAYQGHLSVVAFLWNNGADREALTIQNGTPLHLAADQGHLSVVAFLWNNGANLEALTNDNFTALHLAAYQGHLPVVQFLLAMEGDVTVRNNFDYTAVDLAFINYNNNPAIYDQIIVALEAAAPARRCVMM